MSVTQSRRTVITISEQKIQDDRTQNRKEKSKDHRNNVQVIDEGTGSDVRPRPLFSGKKAQAKAEVSGKRGGKGSRTASKGPVPPLDSSQIGLNKNGNSDASFSKQSQSSVVVAYASELFGTLKSSPLEGAGKTTTGDFMSLASSLYQGGITSSTRCPGGTGLNSVGMSTSNILQSMDRHRPSLGGSSDSGASTSHRQSLVGSDSLANLPTAVTSNSATTTGLVSKAETPVTDIDFGMASPTPVQLNLTPEELTRYVDVELSESVVFNLLDLKGTLCPIDDDSIVQTVQTDNQQYQALCASKEGNDRFAERSMQTTENSSKSRHVQCEPVDLHDKGIEASIADIYDENQKLRLGGDLLASDKGLEVDDLDVELEDLIDEEAKKEAAIGGIEENTTGDPFASKTSSIAMLSTIQGSFVQLDHPKNSKTEKNMVAERMQTLQLQGVLRSESFTKNLMLIERMLSFNDNQDSLAKYRNLRAAQEAAQIANDRAAAGKKRYVEDSVGAKRLFSYICPIFLHEDGIPRTITALALNKKNPDLIAVGYGYYTSPSDRNVNIYNTKSKHKSGVVCCWNLKNLTYPERVYITSAGVTSLDFSRQNTNLLATGCFDGSLMVFNVKNRTTKPIMDSNDTMSGISSQRSGPQNQHGNQRHTAAIWQTEWVERGLGASGEEKSEHLISISADGRVTQWSIRKGFENIDLMKLKRVTGRGTAASAVDKAQQQAKNTGKGKQSEKEVGRPQKTEALISRQAPGLTFAFHQSDVNQYIVGTEEGKIHRCSCSYNEQYLETYSGHKGLVHKIVWSPHDENVFLSCCSDWTAKVWLTDGKEMQNTANGDKRDSAVTLVHGYGNNVNDAAWHPIDTTVFVTLTDKDIRVFDLQQSCLDPIKVINIQREFPQKATEGAADNFVPYPKLTKCTFFPQYPCMSILVGDENGNVTVYEMEKFPAATLNKKKKNLTLAQIVQQARESANSSK